MHSCFLRASAFGLLLACAVLPAAAQGCGAQPQPPALAPAGVTFSTAPVVPWLTRSADNARSGWNPHETVLSQASVTTKGIVRATIIPVYGDACGMEAQPLILPAVTTARGVRDVMVLPSMANVVRGVDAHDGSAIWQVTLGTPITSSLALDMHGINQHWGCLSTGVIDPDLKLLYQVCWISPDNTGNPQTARYRIFVLNVADGTQPVAPVTLQGVSQGQDFNSTLRKQRSSLVETNVNGVKTVLGCAGTVSETGNGAAGFCFAFDVASNTLTALTALTAGEGAGVWMAGQGPAADAQGNLYLITGNGDFDGATQWGESFLKLAYTPPAGASAATLKVADHWTPWTDQMRSGGQALPANKLSGVSAPSQPPEPVGATMHMSFKNAHLRHNVNQQGVPMLLVYPQMPTGVWGDEDWGSAGPACIFALGVCVATGKDGIAYPVKISAMGGTTPNDLKNPAANCKKLAFPPAWLTMSPGGDVDPCPADPTTLNFFPWGATAHLHMTPVQYFDPLLNAWTLFVWGENAQLHKWQVSATGLTYIAQSNEFASADVRGTRQDGPNSPFGGMPGGFCAGSSNGADPNSAILVCTIPYGNANTQVTNGRLLVYDPVHLAPDGSLKVLWDSQRWGVAFLFNKFDPPVIDGGQIYVPNYNGGVDLYTLAP
jgi:hypothetical protein